MIAKFMPSVMAAFVLIHRSLAADPPIVGEWKVQGTDASVTLKSDGTGALDRREPPPKVIRFKWEKTADGATLRFDDVTEIGPSRCGWGRIRMN